MTVPDSSEATPSGAALARSTLLALVIAGVLLVTCVLPAEYGIDPTGVGRMLGLTQMGEVKQAMAEEAAANAAAQASADSAAAEAEAGGGEPPVTAGDAVTGGLTDSLRTPTDSSPARRDATRQAP
jgi:hypothetical protein